MKLKLSTIPIVCWLLLGLSDGSMAQHADILVQEVNGRVMTGSANFEIYVNEVGPRTFQGEFGSAPSGFDCGGTCDYCIELPGYNTVSSTNPSLVPPPGESAYELPERTYVEWDFVPMKVDGVVANLLYWDGSDSSATPGAITKEDVLFGMKPAPGYALEFAGQTATVAAAGEPTIVPGDIIVRTSSTGTMHEHRPYTLVDGDGDPDTDPVDGIYLVGFRLRVGELDRSQTAYIVFGTLFPTVDQLDAAYAWVQDHEDELAPDFGADFDGDLDVDLADLLQLQRGFGTTGEDARQVAGDADWNDLIDAADLAVWQQEFGASMDTFAGAFSNAAILAVPEPGGTFSVGCRRGGAAGPEV